MCMQLMSVPDSEPLHQVSKQHDHVRNLALYRRTHHHHNPASPRHSADGRNQGDSSFGFLRHHHRGADGGGDQTGHASMDAPQPSASAGLMRPSAPMSSMSPFTGGDSNCALARLDRHR